MFLTTQPPPGKLPPRTEALVLASVVTLGLLLFFVGVVVITRLRRSRYFRSLKDDTARRRKAERDAWTESARRTRTPSADDLEEDNQSPTVRE